MLSDEARILQRLSRVEREMMRDQVNGTVRTRTEHEFRPRIESLQPWQAKIETDRLAKLIAAAELDQLDAGTYRGPHRPPVIERKMKRPRGRYGKVAAA